MTDISITIFIVTISSNHFDHQRWIRSINFIQLFYTRQHGIREEK